MKENYSLYNPDLERDFMREKRVEDSYMQKRDPLNVFEMEFEEDRKNEVRDVNSGDDNVEVLAPLLKDKPEPLLSFDDPCIPEFVKKCVNSLGFRVPTTIQKYCKLL